MSELPIVPCTDADFLDIMGSLDEFWDDPRGYLHHRLFATEFGDSAYVARDDGRVAAYLFGVVGTARPRTGYIHLVAVRGPYRRLGLARRLYARFEDHARDNGCTLLKAVTSLGNERSVAFHTAFGMQVTTARHYAGPNEADHRLLFTKPL